MTGRMLDEGRAKISFWVMFVGTLIALLPLFAAGVEGQVTDSYRFFADENVGLFNLVATIGTVILFIGIILAVGNLVRSRSEGAATVPDPWQGSSLEWLALSPPEPHNFDVLPDVRSTEPMRDIRESLVRREAGQEAPAGERQPVA
jgi:heme/copper-type cytochrome/quinol oxidase subunit 1